MTTYDTTNPATGELLKTRTHWTYEQAESALNFAWREFPAWRAKSAKERGHAVANWARALKARREDLAQMMTAEMGKPITQSRAEIDKCIFTCEFLSTEGPKWIEPKKVESVYHESWITYEPLGPILAVMPWNFPLWQVIRFAAPTLIAGNVILLKHADLTAGCAEIIEHTAAEIFPGFKLLQNLPVNHEVAAKLIEHPLLRGVTLTGSTKAGREVAQTCGKNLKKVVLELGGSDPYIVLADADIEKAAKLCAAARLTNSGQSCVAAKRFIVERDKSDMFISSFVKEMALSPPSDPREETCKLGPLAAKRFQEQLVAQVAELKSLGGRIVCGGEAPGGKGAYYPPTVIVFDRAVSKIGAIETFGPVAVVILVDSVEEAIRVANDSPYGLGGALFTHDIERGLKLIGEIESGFVVLNGQVISDVRLAFGGVKDSGNGRELSCHGLHEFCNIKTLAVGTA